MRNSYIVAGWTFEEDVFSAFLEKESEKPFLIAADRGFKYLLELGMECDVIIGDFDSAPLDLLDVAREKSKSGISELIKLNPVKDDTDTEAALDVALKRTDGDIYIFAGIGSRIDHVISNIEILEKARKRGRNAFLVNSKNKIQICDRNSERKILKSKSFGKYISVFPLSGRVDGLTMKGFKYSLADYTLTSGTSLGQSNELVEEEGIISVKDGSLIIVESND
jgi:thiamine pyrophosphokinase